MKKETVLKSIIFIVFGILLYRFGGGMYGYGIFGFILAISGFIGLFFPDWFEKFSSINKSEGGKALIIVIICLVLAYLYIYLR